MALAYTPPGVTVNEIVTPQVSTLLSANALVALVGVAQGFQTATSQFQISGTTGIEIPNFPAGAQLVAVTSVRDALDPSKGAGDGSGYVVTTDYTVDLPTHKISRVGAGGIATPTLINVTYTYVATDYYEPYRLYDMGSVESRYGSALNSAGLAINSPLSYAASIAFENGASSVVCQPLFSRTVGGDPTSAPIQADNSTWGALQTWQDTLYVLRDIEDINVIVPIVGQSMGIIDATILTIEQAVQDHCRTMANFDQYVVALLGEDSSTDSTKATSGVLHSHAIALQGRYGGSLSEQIVLINTSRFTRALPGRDDVITVGGQYMAAALAGMLDSRPTSSTLTRKSVSGFENIADSRNLAQKNSDAQAGLLVLDQKGRNIFVRHAITLDTSSSSRRELSVVRAKHRVIESVKQTLDEQLIGNLIADNNATAIVEGTVIAVLEQLRAQRVLVDYTGVQARIVTLEPTAIQVRFSYRPSFPVNYINIEFSLDLSSGAIISSSQSTL